MPYTAKPNKGHTAEEIRGLLEGREGIKNVDVINGIVVFDADEDYPPELDAIAFVEECVPHDPCNSGAR